MFGARHAPPHRPAQGRRACLRGQQPEPSSGDEVRRADVELRVPADSAYASVLRTDDRRPGRPPRLPDRRHRGPADRRRRGQRDGARRRRVPGTDLTCELLPRARRARRSASACTVDRAIEPDYDSFAWQVLTTLATSATRRGRRTSTFTITRRRMESTRREPVSDMAISATGRRRVRRPHRRRADPAAQRRAVRRSCATRTASEREPRRGPRRAGAPAPAAGRALRPPLPQPRRAARGPRPGRHDRPDQVDRPLRHRARASSSRRTRPRRSSARSSATSATRAGRSGCRGGSRSCGCRSVRRPPSSPSASAAPPRRASSPRRSAARSRRSSRASSPATPTPRSPSTRSDDSDDGAATMLDAIGVDDEALEHVEIRESIKPLLDRLAPAGEADPAAAVLQEHDAVADRRGDRRLADARLPAAQPHPRAAAHLPGGGAAASARQSGLVVVGERGSRLAGWKSPTSDDDRDHRDRDRDRRWCRRRGSSRPRPSWISWASTTGLRAHDCAADQRPGAAAAARRRTPTKKSVVVTPIASRSGVEAGQLEHGEDEQQQTLDGDQRGGDDEGRRAVGRSGRRRHVTGRSLEEHGHRSRRQHAPIVDWL